MIERKIIIGIEVNKMVEGEKYRSIMSKIIPEVKFVDLGNSARKLSDKARRETFVCAKTDQYINIMSTKSTNRNFPAGSLAANS